MPKKTKNIDYTFETNDNSFKIAEDNIAEDLLRKQIAKLKRGRRFIYYDESGDFASNLALTRDGIVKLSSVNSCLAFELMIEFIKTGNRSLERCDDSGGYVYSEYIQACEDLSSIALSANITIEAAVDVVFSLIEHDEIYICDVIISDFKDVLQDRGVAILKDKIVELLDRQRVEKKALEKFEKKDGSCDFDDTKESLIDISKRVRDSALYKIRHCLKEIADIRGNVDEYILALVYPKTDYTMDDIYAVEKLKVAERLIKSNRGQEALNWIECAKKLSEDYFDSIMDLKAKAFDIVGDSQKAHATRVEWFSATLEHKVFEQILQHLNETEADEFTKSAVEYAFSFKYVDFALDFLLNCKFLDKCSELVQNRLDDVIGRNYQLLRNVAKALAKDEYFLSSALLYRKLAEDIISKVKSKYYKYAAKDLYACEELDKYILDYGKFESHAVFYAKFAERHKLKRSFWSAYNSVIQSNIDKAKRRDKKIQ